MYYINGEGIGFMAAKKDYAAMCSAIVSACGGEQNIANVAHCMTRLRLQLKDASTFDESAAKAVSGVIGLVVQNGEYQFVIGQDVPSLYEEFLKIESIAAGGSVDDPQTAKVDHKDHGSVVNAILSFLGGTFSPVIPVIVAGGLTGAVLTLLVNFCGVSSDSGTYQFFSCINQATFYFLPVFIGFSAAQRLKSNGYLGAFLGAVLLFYTITDERKKLVSFAGPYYYTQQAILVLADNDDIKSVDDLADKNVAVQSGSNGPAILEEFAPKASQQEFKTDEEARQALQQGRVDAYVIDNNMQQSALVREPGKYKIAGKPFGSKEPYGIGLPLDSDGVAFVNDFLKKIEDDGTWTELWQICIGDRTGDTNVPELPEIGA